METTRKPYGRRPVVAVSPKGEIVAYFESMTAASKDTGVCVSNICQAVRKGLFRRKLKWMYEEDYREYWMSGRTEELMYNRRKERNENIRVALRNLSPETKENRRKKLSEYAKRRYVEDKNHLLKIYTEKRKRKIRCVTTGEEFDSINAFCQKHGATPGNAWLCLNGKRKHVAGVKIEYLN